MMYKLLLQILVVLCFSSLFSCQSKVVRKIDVPEDLKFLGHKGSGPVDKNGNINLIENTWESVANAINHLDGSEIDVQMSNDSTLWVFHDHKILNCEDTLVNLFLNSDSEISEMNQCNYRNGLMKLSTLLSRAKSQDWKGKTVSLDLKLLINPEVNKNFGTHENLVGFTVNKLEKLIEDTDLNILFQVFTTDEYAYFNRTFNGMVYLVDTAPNYNSVKERNSNNINISCPIYEFGDSLDESEIHVQSLWTINTANQMIKSLKLSPSFLESDNIPLMSFFKSIQKGNQLKSRVINDYSIQLKDEEFYELLTIDLPTQQPTLIQYETTAGNFPRNASLVFSGFSESTDNVDWRNIHLNKNQDGYFFLNSDYLEHLGAEKVKIYIYNQDKKEIDAKLKLYHFVLDTSEIN